MAHFKFEFFPDPFPTGNYLHLIKNRFASHVIEKLLKVSINLFAEDQKPIESENGTLDTIRQLVLRVWDEIKPDISEIIEYDFSSHCLRALIVTFASDSAFY